MTPAGSALIAPWAILVVASVCILFAALFRVPHRLVAWVSMASLVTSTVLLVIILISGQGGHIQGMIKVDGWTALISVLLSGAGGATILAELGTGRNMPSVGGYALLLLAVVGALVSASATHLIALVLGLAILSLATAALLGPTQAWPYLVAHSAGLASSLLGTALLYGATGSFDTEVLAQTLARSTAARSVGPLLDLGTSFVLIGIAVQLGLFPFHSWVKRAFCGNWLPAPMLIALLMPCLALTTVQRIPHLSLQANGIASVLAAASLIWGYAGAFRSRRLRALLANLAIAQCGLVLVVQLGIPDSGQAAACLAICSTTAIACLWALVAYVEHQVDTWAEWGDLWGLIGRRPIIGGAASLCVFSLAAMPPLIGGAAQFYCLQQAIRENRGAVAAVLLAGISLAGLCAIRWSAVLWTRPPRWSYKSRATPELGVITATAAIVAVTAGLLFEPLLSWIIWLAIH